MIQRLAPSIFVLPILLLQIMLLLPTLLAAQKDLGYYLPQDVSYNDAIPTPESVFGFQVGEWHVRHDQLLRYMEVVAEASDRVTITPYGRSYEGRQQVLLTITSPRNQANIDQIRQRHLQLTDPERSGDLDVSGMPAVVWLGYSVHGNEPSGSNAAPLSAYYYAAARGPVIDELLENTVILIDPSINPDGLDRFASWVNQNRSFTQNTDPNTREHRENWPGSRTNHYWFDLNRDWMPIQHPESRGRIEMYNHWMPHVLTDHHEMGTSATYFFQPGIPSRNNPLTPERNFELTAKLAEYHAEFLNEIGSLYYTKESFDDFYPGKGSTYPDLRGTIGILFEQASSRGHLQESPHGDLGFPFTIKNQFLTSLSTVKGTNELRVDFNTYMRDFYRTAIEESRRTAIGGYVFGDAHDPARVYHLIDILRGHQIEVYRLGRDVTIDGNNFAAGQAWVVPAEQPQYRFLTSLFEKRTTFTDSLFYDISTWTLPLAFNIPYAELQGRAWNRNLLGDRLDTPEFPSAILHDLTDPYAWVFEWDGYYAPRALNRLLDKNVRVKVASRPFSAATVIGRRDFTYGTILVATGIQDAIGRADLNRIMQTIADEDAIDVFALDTGLSLDGIDLGSPNFNTLRKPGILVVVGSGVTQAEAGEIWHQFDQRYKIAVSMVDIDQFNGASLDKYNTIVLVNGSYSRITSGAVERLRRWISSGGTLIAQKSAARWAVNNNLAKASFKRTGDDEDNDNDNDNDDNGNSDDEERRPAKPYIDAALNRGAQMIGGSIFEARLDLTHPLAYGFRRDMISVFRNSTLMMEAPENAYSAPLRYTSEPLLSGYISPQNLDRLRDTPGIIVSGVGSGRTILMTDNPNFRAFWFGTNKLFANAVFFGHTVSGITVER